MTPSPQHQEQAEAMARIVIQLISPMNEAACLQYLPKVLRALNLPQLLAYQAECAIANKALEAACQCAEQFKKERNEALERHKIVAETVNQYAVLAGNAKEQRDKWQAECERLRKENDNLLEIGQLSKVSLLEKERDQLRTQNTALIAVARAAKQQASRLSANTLIELKDALTTAIQSGVELEGV